MTASTSTISASQAALTLATDPTVMAAAAGTVVAAGAAVGVAALVYKKYAAYKEKKHRAEIEYVNGLHKRYLDRIPIYENRQIQGFPPIYKLNKDEKSTNAESLHFTDDEIKDVGNGIMPQGMDEALAKYRECILNAILKLKDYYLTRKKRNKKKGHDVTSGVLSYLLYMLEKKLLNFEGYEYDIAYLNAFSSFILEYMSKDDTKKSQHFQRLDPVRAYLREAKQELEKHQKALSLGSMISDLHRNTVGASKKLLRSFAQFITPDKDWEYVKTATFDELENNILRKKYTRSRVGRIVFWTDKKKEIPSSLFKDWLSSMLKYFDDSINRASKMKVEDILPPEKMFVLPDLERRDELKEKFISRTKSEKEELNSINAGLKSIHKLFAKCNNFITTKLDLATAHDVPKYVHIKSEEELLSRSKVLADFATMIHQTISLQYMSVYLSKSLKQLGEIYMRNPEHFVLIFETLERLCDQIAQTIENNRVAINDIQKMNLNRSQLARKELFSEETLNLLDSTSTIIARINKKIKEYRDGVESNGDVMKPTVESVNEEMFVIANKIVNLYQFNQPPVSENPETLTEKSPEALLEKFMQESVTPSMQANPDPQEPLPMNQELTQEPLPLRQPHHQQSPPINDTAPQPTFWQKHKYKILAAVAITVSVVSFLLALGLSIFSGGTLSPIAAIVVGVGAKIGMAGLALAGVDALFGLAIGVLGGGVVDAVIVSSVAIHDSFMSHKRIHHKLKSNKAHSASNDADVSKDSASKPTRATRFGERKVANTPKLWRAKSDVQMNEMSEDKRKTQRRSAFYRST